MMMYPVKLCEGDTTNAHVLFISLNNRKTVNYEKAENTLDRR